MGLSPKFKLNNPFSGMPKIELHRHLEGSLRVSTLLEIASEYKIDIPDTNQFARSVQVQGDEPKSYVNFLSKFSVLRNFYKSEKTIRRLCYEVVEDAARDSIRYMELRFTPIALSRNAGFPLHKVIDWVTESVADANARLAIDTRLIVSVNRHESLSDAEEVIKLSAKYIDRGVVGVDLAGNEADFPAMPFADILKEAQYLGLSLTLHAGEWFGVNNVREVIEDLKAQRIGHGVRIVDDPELMAIAKELAIPFEVCITSNVHSGVVSDLKSHPISQMLDAGLNVTINTDDPGISQITLSDEYWLLHQEFGYSFEELYVFLSSSLSAAFIDDSERNRLEAQVKTEFINWLELTEG